MNDRRAFADFQPRHFRFEVQDQVALVTIDRP